MTETGTVLVAEIPTVTAVAFAALAWMIKRLIGRIDHLDERLDEQDREQASLTGEVATQSVRLTALERVVDSHDRRIPTLSENLAVVAAFVERHERWHEQQRGDAHDTPPA